MSIRLVLSAALAAICAGPPAASAASPRAALVIDAPALAAMLRDPRDARNVPFTEIADDRMVLKTPAALEQLFATAGVRAGDTVIGYCHIGQQATAMLFAARTLGHPVLLYDGSFEDWSRQDDAPVENPSRK